MFDYPHRPRSSRPPPDNIGPPYFEIHAEGWALIIVLTLAIGLIVRWAFWG